jgi:hypothetical protein
VFRYSRRTQLTAGIAAIRLAAQDLFTWSGPSAVAMILDRTADRDYLAGIM